MRKLHLLLLAAALPACAAITNVAVVSATNTEAIIQWTAPNVGACTLEVSESASFSALIHDVDTALYSGANLASRPDNIITGNTVQFMVGHRGQAYFATAAGADTSKSYSRALPQNTTLYHRITCGSDQATGAFSTEPVKFGTYADAIPGGPNGKPAWPSILAMVRCNSGDTGCSTVRRGEKIIDPQSGVTMSHLNLGMDNVLSGGGADSTMQIAFGNGWTNAAAASREYATGFASTTTTNPLASVAPNSRVFTVGDMYPGSGISNPVILQAQLNAYINNGACDGSNTSDGCKIELCVTTNGVSCNARAAQYEQVVSSTSKTYTLGSGQPYDVMQKPNQAPWNHEETGSRLGRVTCDGSSLVSLNWGGSNFPVDQYVNGSILYINYDVYTVTNVVDALHVNVSPNCPSSAANAVDVNDNAANGSNGSWSLAPWSHIYCDGTNTPMLNWDPANGSYYNNTNPSQSPFPSRLGAGWWIYIGPDPAITAGAGWHQITGNPDAKHLTLDSACSGNAWTWTSGSTSSSNFGFLIWKKISDGSTLNVNGVTEITTGAKASQPNFYGGFRGTPIKATVNGHPAGVYEDPQGLYSVDLTTGDSYAFADSSGPGGNTLFDATGSEYCFNVSIGQNWSVCDTAGGTSLPYAGYLAKYKYVGDYQTPTTSQVRWSDPAKTPLWQWDHGTTLQHCDGVTYTTRCWQVTDVTQPTGDSMFALAAAFDSRYELDHFNDWELVSNEEGKLIFDISATHSEGSWYESMRGGQNYYSWTLIFDPNATTNGQPGNAGCITVKNPGVPGCVIAMRPEWESPGYRWGKVKGYGDMLRDHWAAFTAAPYDDTDKRPVATEVGSFTSVSCPSAYSAYSCIQMVVDGDPWMDWYGQSWWRGHIGTYAVGDYATLGAFYASGAHPDSFPLLVVAQISGYSGPNSNLTLTLACKFSCPTDNSANQRLWMMPNWDGYYQPWSGRFISYFIYWDYFDDPHGYNSNGSTVVWNYSGDSAHGFVANSIMGSSQLNYLFNTCTANQGCYSTHDWRGTTDAQFGALATNQSGVQPTGVTAISPYFAGRQGAAGQECGNCAQLHPDFSRQGVGDPVAGYSVDARVFAGFSNLPAPSMVSHVSGDLYKICYTVTVGSCNSNNTLNPKIFDTQGYAGMRVLSNVSGPGSTIDGTSGHAYQLCYAYATNECQSGSAPGDVFVNIPYFVTGFGGCYFGDSGFANGTTDLMGPNDACVFDADAVQQSYTRYSTTQIDNVGSTVQSLSHGMLGGRGDIFLALRPLHTVDDPAWPAAYAFVTQNADDQGFQDWVMLAPPISVDTATRTTFQAYTMSLKAIPGATKAAVEFSYPQYGGLSAGRCSANSTDRCVATGSTINEGNPFYWETDEATAISGALQTCTSGCSVAVPLHGQRTVEITPLYYDVAGNIVGRGQPRLIQTP